MCLHLQSKGRGIIDKMLLLMLHVMVTGYCSKYTYKIDSNYNFVLVSLFSTSSIKIYLDNPKSTNI